MNLRWITKVLFPFFTRQWLAIDLGMLRHLGIEHHIVRGQLRMQIRGGQLLPSRHGVRQALQRPA
jgi:hypothetical protein